MTALQPPPVELAGRHITLKPLQRAELPALFEALNDPRVYAGGWGGGPAGYHATEDSFVAWATDHFTFDRNLVYGVWMNDAIVGTSTLGDIDLVSEHAHIGWTAFSPAVWGTVVNTESKLLLLGHAFDHGIGRVKLQADVLNDRSRAAILKLGAQFEGIVRRDRLRADGTWRDTAVYSLLIDEWPAVRRALEQRIDV